MPSKYLIAEQARRMLAAGDPSSSFMPEMEELKAAIGQAINTLTKAQFFGETLAGGETIPEGCVLAEYEDIAVTTVNGLSECTLPATPQKLPRNMGVYHVGPANDPTCQYIPIPLGQSNFVGAQRGMSTLLDQVGYMVKGKKLQFTEDLSAADPVVTAVDMQLVVMDMSKYNDYETLPINADMEQQVIMMVVEQFSGRQRKLNINDPSKDNA